MANVVDAFSQNGRFVRLCLFRGHHVAKFSDLVVDGAPVRGWEETKEKLAREKEKDKKEEERSPITLGYVLN